MINKPKEFWEEVCQLLLETSVEYCEVREEYHGRFFETAEAALVTDFSQAEVSAAITEVLKENGLSFSEIQEEIKNLSWDNMGKTAMIYY